jgi:hypothetical protein
MNKFLKFGLVSSLILSGEVFNPQNITNGDKYNLERFKNGDVITHSSGSIYTSEKDEPEIEVKKGDKVLDEGMEEGNGIYFNLKDQLNNERCKLNQIVVTAGHIAEISKEQETRSRPIVFNGVFSSNDSRHPKNTEHNYNDNLSTFSRYINKNHDVGFYLSKQTSQECFDQFANSIPKIIPGESISLRTRRNFEQLHGDKNEQYEINSKQKTNYDYSLNPGEVKGKIIDINNEGLFKLISESGGKYNQDALKTSSIPVLYPKIKLPDDSFVEPTTGGSSGSPTFTNNEYLGPHIASFSNKSEKVINSIQKYCSDNNIQSIICANLKGVNPRENIIGFVANIRDSLKDKPVILDK